MKNLKTLLSSENMDWGTPQAFFDDLDKEFGFTLDPCATNKTAKCKTYFTKKTNGLIQDWSQNTVFCNPPYGGEIKHWVKKCYDESQKPDTTVVMLIPARTDTTYWHEYIFPNAEVRFIKGRLKFEGLQKGSGSAPFPSALVIFRPPIPKSIETIRGENA